MRLSWCDALPVVSYFEFCAIILASVCRLLSLYSVFPYALYHPSVTFDKNWAKRHQVPVPMSVKLFAFLFALYAFASTTNLFKYKYR